MKRTLEAADPPTPRAFDQSFLHIAETLNQSLDLESTAQRIVDYMVTGLGSSGGVLFLRHPTTKEAYPYTVSAVPIVRRALGALPRPFRSHRYPIETPENHIGRCFRDAEVIEGDDLADFLRPHPATPICRAMQRIVGAKSLIALPVLIHREVAGALLLTFPEESVGTDRRFRLQIFANLVATAIASRREERPPKPHTLRHLEDDFIALVAHELGSPVVSIRMLLTLLGNDPELREHLRTKDSGLLDNLLLESDRLQSLVANVEFVLTTRGDWGAEDWEPLSLVSLVTQTRNKMDLDDLFPGTKVRVSYPSGAAVPMVVRGDRRQLEHVIWELLTNVRKHAGAGVEVFLRLRYRFDPIGRFAELTVYDRGVGIPCEARERAFRERFAFGEAMLHKSTPGLGLGLYVARRIIERHGGSIRIRSSAARGTAVTLRLPLVDAAPGSLAR